MRVFNLPDLGEGLQEATIVEWHVKPGDTIAADQPLFGEGLGLDSIDALELVVALEREFGIAIANENVGRESLASIAAIEELVRGQLPATRTANG